MLLPSVLFYAAAGAPFFLIALLRPIWFKEAGWSLYLGYWHPRRRLLGALLAALLWPRVIFVVWRRQRERALS